MYVHLSNSALAAAITRRSSHQTYLTIRLLVDRERVAEAFRAYAYFRWVDDHLDQPAGSQTERLAFLKRQEDLVKQCEWGQLPSNLSAEEKLLVDLLRSDPNPQSGLRAYIQNMMAVMRFDTERRGRMITQDELGTYTHWLAVAVTEALHYFLLVTAAPPPTMKPATRPSPRLTSSTCFETPSKTPAWVITIFHAR